MAIAFVQAWTGVQGNAVASVTTGTLTTTSGNFIGVGQTCDASASTISDNKSNTVAVAIGPIQNASDYIQIAYFKNIVGGASHTVTSTRSGAGYHTLCPAEFSGLDLTAPLDQTASATGTSTALNSGNTSTTTVANELLLGTGTISAGTNSSWTAGTNFTMRGSVGNALAGAVGYLESRIVSATGAYAAPATWGGSSDGWIAAIATFKESTTGELLPRNMIISQAVSRSMNW